MYHTLHFAITIRGKGDIFVISAWCCAYKMLSIQKQRPQWTDIINGSALVGCAYFRHFKEALNISRFVQFLDEVIISRVGKCLDSCTYFCQAVRQQLVAMQEICD